MVMKFLITFANVAERSSILKKVPNQFTMKPNLHMYTTKFQGDKILMYIANLANTFMGICH